MECECKELKKWWKARRLNWEDIKRIKKIFIEVDSYWDTDRATVVYMLECNECGIITCVPRRK